jgi:hypothetical protein
MTRAGAGTQQRNVSIASENVFMHPQVTVERARALSGQGLTHREVATAVGVPLPTGRKWRTGQRRAPGPRKTLRTYCHRCYQAPLDEPAYAYLLGLYLGDGHISHGYRRMNRVRRVWAGQEHWYEYPRYLFGSESLDIMELCGAALDLLDVEWRFARYNMLSVAKKESVARLDEFVGPKY